MKGKGKHVRQSNRDGEGREDKEEEEQVQGG